MNAVVEEREEPSGNHRHWEIEEWTCRWSIIDVEMGFLDALAVVSLGIGEPEQSLF